MFSSGWDGVYAVREAILAMSDITLAVMVLLFSINWVRVICLVVASTARLSTYPSRCVNVLGESVASSKGVTKLAVPLYADFPTAYICHLYARWAAQHGAWEVIQGKAGHGCNGEELIVGHGKVCPCQFMLSFLKHINILRDAIGVSIAPHHVSRKIDQFTGCSPP